MRGKVKGILLNYPTKASRYLNLNLNLPLQSQLVYSFVVVTVSTSGLITIASLMPVNIYLLYNIITDFINQPVSDVFNYTQENIAYAFRLRPMPHNNFYMLSQYNYIMAFLPFILPLLAKFWMSFFNNLMSSIDSFFTSSFKKLIVVGNNLKPNLTKLKSKTFDVLKGIPSWLRNYTVFMNRSSSTNQSSSTNESSSTTQSSTTPPPTVGRIYSRYRRIMDIVRRVEYAAYNGMILLELLSRHQNPDLLEQVREDLDDDLNERYRIGALTQQESDFMTRVILNTVFSYTPGQHQSFIDNIVEYYPYSIDSDVLPSWVHRHPVEELVQLLHEYILDQVGLLNLLLQHLEELPNTELVSSLKAYIREFLNNLNNS